MKTLRWLSTIRGSKSDAPHGRVVRRSTTPVSHTGGTGEVALAAVRLPPNVMGASGRLLVEGRVSCTSSSDQKTPRVKFGGVTYLSASLTNSKWWRFELKIRNRGAANSQEGSGFALLSTGALLGSGAASSTVDTSNSVDIMITGELANAADRITLEMYQVIVYSR